MMTIVQRRRHATSTRGGEGEERRIERGISRYTAAVADMIHSLNAILLYVMSV